MSFQAMTWASKQQLPAAKKCLLYTIANYAGPDGQFWPSYQRLADDAGLSRRSVMKYMAEFEAGGMIRKARRKKSNGESDTNIFVLVMNSAGSEGDSLGSGPRSLGGERDSLGVVNEVHRGSEPDSPKSVIEPVIQPVSDTGKKSPALDLTSLPNGITVELAQAFIDHRKAIKAPLSQQALSLCMNAAAKAVNYGLTPQQVIEETIVNGWRKPEPEWVANRLAGKGSAPGMTVVHGSTANQPHRPAMPKPERAPRRQAETGGGA